MTDASQKRGGTVESGDARFEAEDATTSADGAKAEKVTASDAAQASGAASNADGEATGGKAANAAGAAAGGAVMKSGQGGAGGAKRQGALRKGGGKGGNKRALAQRRAPSAPPRRKVRARAKPRHWLLILSFILLVVAPGIYANWYLQEKAADQYASSMAFTVSSDDGPTSILEDFIMGGGSGGTADPTEVLYGFIRSQNLVETLQDKLDLQSIYSKHPEDWFFSLGDDRSIEALVDHWRSVCIVSFAGGIVSVEIRAFDPKDAQTLAQAVLEESTKLINRMSAEAREDALKDAQAYLDEREEKLRLARLELQRARSQEEIIDPTGAIAKALERIATLETQLDQERLRLDKLKTFAPSGDSRILEAEQAIKTIRSLIEEEQAKIASRKGLSGTLSESVGRFEELSVDVEIAQSAFTAALASYEGARREAQRQEIYLTAHNAPTLAQTAEYPERYLLGALAVVFLFLGWVVLVMVGYNVKDRR